MFLFETHPHLAEEWHPTLNEQPFTSIITSSTLRAWWVCSKGHEWQVSVLRRKVGSPCQYCAGILAIPGETDFITTHPLIGKQWHLTKNQGIDPTTLLPGSNVKAWWQDEHGHEWESPICSMVKGHGCPFCSGRKPILGVTDLSTTHPNLAAQWHPTSNLPVEKHEVAKGNSSKWWWQCEQGHTWQSPIYNRINLNSGCPYCSGHKAIQGVNDLATVAPNFLKQWHPTKNGKHHPQDFTVSSNKKMWWLCDKGHEWIAGINKRTSGNNCPICGNKQLLEGYNDLATTHPVLAKEWHPSKNENHLPTEIFGGNVTKVWWLCENNHAYLTSPNKRVVMGRGCPYCTGQKRVVGINDLKTTHPKITTQWDFAKNADLHIEDYGYGSNKVVWWLCDKGHSWKSSIAARTKAFTSCLVCNPVHQSQVEITLYGHLQKKYPQAFSGKRLESPSGKRKYAHVDIFITTDLGDIVIEYDGKHWHGTEEAKTKDISKTQALLDRNYKVIRIRENKLFSLSLDHPHYAEIAYTYGTSLEALIEQIDKTILAMPSV
jgi:very-short-patch-repair endonuclease